MHQRLVVWFGLRSRRRGLGREALRWWSDHGHRDRARRSNEWCGTRARWCRRESHDARPHRLAEGEAHPLIAGHVPRHLLRHLRRHVGGADAGRGRVVAGAGVPHPHRAGHGARHLLLTRGGHDAEHSARRQPELKAEQHRHKDRSGARSTGARHDRTILPPAAADFQRRHQ